MSEEPPPEFSQMSYCEGVHKIPETKSTKALKDTGMHISEIVEDKIHSMMDKSPCGQLLFDGCTVNGVHYVGLFASFMTPLKVVYKGSLRIEWKHELQLISVDPIPGMKRIGSDREEVEDEEAIQFDADHHIHAFEEVFNIFKLGKV